MRGRGSAGLDDKKIRVDGLEPNTVTHDILEEVWLNKNTNC
jgi:hypothetical protein